MSYRNAPLKALCQSLTESSIAELGVGGATRSMDVCASHRKAAEIGPAFPPDFQQRDSR
jgi:hypothetical protein